jgi:hypothetical protein
MAKTLTRTEALRRSRERAAAQLERVTKLIELGADWAIATAQLNGVYTTMYQLGLTRSEIAQHLEIPLAQVPKREDLDDDDAVEDVAVEGVRNDDDAAGSGVDRGDDE